MPVTLDATVGGGSANAYADVTWADAFMNAWHDASDRDTWADADGDDKKRALITATTLLDARMSWFGSVTTEGQRLLWPRSDVTAANGYVLSSAIVPESLKQATALYALALLETALDASDETLTIPPQLTELTVGPVSMAFSEKKTTANWAQSPIPAGVLALLRFLGYLTGGVSRPLVRV